MPDGFDLELDIEGFRQWTEAAIKDAEKEVGTKVLRALALDFIRRVIEKTPVDFGRARAGWTSFAVSLGRSPRIAAGSGKGRAPGVTTSGKGLRLSASEEQAQGLKEGSFRQNLKGSSQFIELINGVPYIVHLEFGSSRQAPAGMMRVTFKEMQAADVMTKQMSRDLQASWIRVNRKLKRQRISARAVT